MASIVKDLAFGAKQKHSNLHKVRNQNKKYPGWIHEFYCE